MKIEIREMAIGDYNEVIALWRGLEMIGLSVADEKDQVERFLEANPTTSLVAKADGKIAGTVLGGYDGRRGYIYHLAVVEGMRGRGLGAMLMDELELRFRKLGASRIHLMIYNDNEAWKFYEKRGYFRRDGELFIMSRDLD